MICQYAIGAKNRGMVRRILLRGLAAAGLAAVLDAAGPVSATARRCDKPRNRLPFAQVLVFGYRHDPARSAAVSYTTCSLAVITAGRHSAELAGVVSDDLFGYTGIARRHGRHPVPDLIGRGAVMAVTAARQHRYGVTFDGLAFDRAVPVGTVLFQVPPQGAGPGSPPVRQVGVVIAVRPAPRCGARQLALGYLGGEPGAGNDFGTVLIRDISRRACRLPGPVRLTGLDKAGRPDTGAVRLAMPPVAILSPRARPVGRSPGDRLTGVRPGEAIGQLTLIAEYRDDPTGADKGICEPHWIVPASWRLTLPSGRSLTVANADRSNPGGILPSGGFVTCRGEMAAAGPAEVGWLG